MKALLVLSAATLLLLAACGSESIDVDYSTFDAVPDLRDINLAALRPADTPDYIELRQGYEFGDVFSVVVSQGSKCRGAPDSAVCLEALENARAEHGFGYVTHPGMFFSYFVTTSAGDVTVWSSRDELRRFLGEIDAPEEALLIALAQDLYWMEGDKANGAIRTSGSGYDLIVRRTDNWCPITRSRVLIHVDRDGKVTTLQEEPIPSNGACA